MPVERDYVFPELHAGMDHEHYDWSPLNASRAVLRWPENARVALCVIVTFEHRDGAVPRIATRYPSSPVAMARAPFPTSRPGRIGSMDTVSASSAS